MLCKKISENARNGFLELLARGMNKIKKRKYFRKSLKLSFAPDLGMFHGKGCFLGHPIVHVQIFVQNPNDL